MSVLSVIFGGSSKLCLQCFCLDVQAVGYPYTVTCDLDLGFHYPQWLGPPKAILYSRDGTARLTPESKAHSDEIEWAENKRDLVITEVKEKHAGVYSCEHDGKRRSEVTVHPERKSLTFVFLLFSLNNE